MTTTRARRTQEERTAATRKALLDATVDCLVEYGYHGTTTTRVVDRAGVSRGAQVHHFPTKNDLVMAAVQHLAGRRTTAFMEHDLHRLRCSDDWIGDALDLLWEVHQGPLFEASMEMWVAARTDSELRGQVESFERMVTTSVLELARALVGDRVDEPAFEIDLYVVLDTIRGLRMLSFVHPGSTQRITARWLRTKDRLRDVLGHWAGR